MEVDIVTFSCNDSPMYYEFWNPISKFWKTKFNIHPVLLYCGDEPISLSEEYGTVHRHPSVKGVPSYLSAVWGRFWITKMYPDKTCLTGDIDLIPLSKAFLSKELSSYDDDAYVHLDADIYYRGDINAWKKPYHNLTAHDHVAKGYVYDKVYGFDEEFEDEMKKMASFDYKKTAEHPEKPGYAFHPEPHLRHASSDNGGKWSQDETYSSEMIRKYYNSGGKVRCDLSLSHLKNVHRPEWTYNPSDVMMGKYGTSHMLRPYSRFKDEIDFLMNLVPNYSK